jgi:hypothetical protein
VHPVGRPGLGTDRPNLVGDPNSGPQTAGAWFNPAAFQCNQPLTFGNSGRDTVIGPPYGNLDLAIMKNQKPTKAGPGASGWSSST